MQEYLIGDEQNLHAFVKLPRIHRIIKYQLLPNIHLISIISNILILCLLFQLHNSVGNQTSLCFPICTNCFLHMHQSCYISADDTTKDAWPAVQCPGARVHLGRRMTGGGAKKGLLVADCLYTRDLVIQTDTALSICQQQGLVTQ